MSAWVFGISLCKLTLRFGGRAGRRVVSIAAVDGGSLVTHEGEGDGAEPVTLLAKRVALAVGEGVTMPPLTSSL